MKNFLHKLKQRVDDVCDTIVESVDQDESDAYTPRDVLSILQPVIGALAPLYPPSGNPNSLNFFNDDEKNFDWLEQKFHFLASSNARTFRRILFQTGFGTYVGFQTATRLQRNSPTSNGIFFTLLIIMYALVKSNVLTPINFRHSIRKLVNSATMDTYYRSLIKNWIFWTFESFTSFLKFLLTNIPTTLGMAIGTLIAYRQRIQKQTQT